MINPPEFKWMIFKPEGTDVLYLWDGKWAVPIHVPSHEGEQSTWYWNGPTGADIPESEINLINDVMNSKRKQIFKVPRKDRRFQVVNRGIYEYDNL